METCLNIRKIFDLLNCPEDELSTLCATIIKSFIVRAQIQMADFHIPHGSL